MVLQILQNRKYHVTDTPLKSGQPVKQGNLLMTSVASRTGFMDVSTASLEHPELARQAILLAAKQYR